MTTEQLPISRQLPCTLCSPHEHHLDACDRTGCVCANPPIPGITL